MTSSRLEIAVTGDLAARLVFTDRLEAGPAGSSRAPFHWSNLASHVGDDATAVRANRVGLAHLLGVLPEQMVFMHPDHGRGVALVGGAQGSASDRSATATGVDPGREIADVDALVTGEVGVGLVALAADCVPVLLVSRDPELVAVVHSGWRGFVLDVVGAALGQLQGLGAAPEKVHAWLGPAICGDCYAVPAERAAEVAQVDPVAVSVARDGQPSLDLRAGIVARLARAGVACDLAGGCSVEDPNLYSYRRDGITGRQAGAIALVRAGSGVPA